MCNNSSSWLLDLYFDCYKMVTVVSITSLSNLREVRSWIEKERVISVFCMLQRAHSCSCRRVVPRGKELKQIQNMKRYIMRRQSAPALISIMNVLSVNMRLKIALRVAYHVQRWLVLP